MDWRERVIARVSAHEGGYGSMNLNTDGAGLSFGLLQWSQRSGDLGELLSVMYQADPGRFAAVFGPGWAELLTVTRAGGVTEVGGRALWEEPWVGRFRSAGRDVVFQAVQSHVAAEGEHFAGALEGVALLGIPTERAVALLYDTCVQQGVGSGRSLAKRVRNHFAGRSAQVMEVLKAFAELAPAKYRRPTPPDPGTSRFQWRQVGGEWHAFVGNYDLYLGILTRRMGIVTDPSLGDTVLTELA